MQDCLYPIAYALETLQSCTRPSVYNTIGYQTTTNFDNMVGVQFLAQYVIQFAMSCSLALY